LVCTQATPAGNFLAVASHGPELVVNVHEDGTAGGYVTAQAFLNSMMGAANADGSAAAAASHLPC